MVAAAAARVAAAAPTQQTTCVANRAVLRLAPAASVAAVPGFESIHAIADDAVLVPLGPLTYDQPRHLLVATNAGAPPLSFSDCWMRWSTARLMSRCSRLPKSLNMVEPPDSTMFL